MTVSSICLVKSIVRKLYYYFIRIPLFIIIHIVITLLEYY